MALVIILDDDADLRETMMDVVRLSCGHECIGIDSHAALVELGDRIFDSDLAILDINLGSGVPSGVDSYQWLRQRGYTGRIVFLTGHARTHPQVEKAYHVGDARVLEKPITADQLCALIEKRRSG